MQHEFVSDSVVFIDSAGPNTVQSVIEVDLPASATVDKIMIRVDIQHSWDSDLIITLIAPDGTSVVLANRNGGSRDDFSGTIFTADAAVSLSAGSPPFRGTFKPVGDLQSIQGKDATGTWMLSIEDKANLDGGSLNGWSIEMDLQNTSNSPFLIDVRFMGGLSTAQQQAFFAAAQRWSEIITADLPAVMIDGEEIDDVLILAQGSHMDGPGGTLGAAGPTHLRFGSSLPAKGSMTFDSADLDNMEATGQLTDVILHEMGHVLGFGTLWSTLSLIVGEGSNNPVFIGANAQNEYATLSGRTDFTPVPVANTGGQGTRDGHWRETVFGDELLTGYISGATRPLSRLSIAAFEDMGYQVNYAAAEPYSVPTPFALGEMGVFEAHSARAHYTIERTEPVFLSPDAVVNR